VAITTLSSREVNQDLSRAKRATRKGPVFITDRGRPAHVLMSIGEYRKITKKSENILDLLYMPEAAEIDFEPPPLHLQLYKPADFS
jgi:prevent-host-death family protein